MHPPAVRFGSDQIHSEHIKKTQGKHIQSRSGETGGRGDRVWERRVSLSPAGSVQCTVCRHACGHTQVSCRSFVTTNAEHKLNSDLNRFVPRSPFFPLSLPPLLSLVLPPLLCLWSLFHFSFLVRDASVPRWRWWAALPHTNVGGDGGGSAHHHHRIDTHSYTRIWSG